MQDISYGGGATSCGLALEEGIQLDIENCCNMTLCDTVGFQTEQGIKVAILVLTELGTRQFFSFATTTTRQRNRASRTSQGPEKIRKIVRPQCLDGVATTNIVKWQLETTLCPENMVTLSRKNCRVPSLFSHLLWA